MGIMDELSSIDKKLQDDLEERRINAEKVEEDRRKAELERKENEKRTQKELKTEKIQEILEDSDEVLDEPHIYKINYSHSQGGGYGYGPHIEKGTASCEVLMTEREKRIAQLTGYIEKCTNADLLAYGCQCTGVKSIMPSSRELSDEEKMKIDSIKKKVSIIKTNEEAENDCIFDLYDDQFESIQVNTSLRNALLSSVSIKNGKIITQEKDITPEQQTEQTRSDLPVKAESKISFRTLRETIKKVLGRGER